MQGNNNKPRVTRRTVLKTGAGSALGGVIAPPVWGKELPIETETRNVYELLGVKSLINAAGTITTLGGSIMPAEVVAAWTAASQSFVDLVELQDRVGEKIADLLGVEGALVTTGAAGAIVVGTAAAVTHRDPALIPRLPLPPEMGVEVICQKAHRACYDQQVAATGVKIVEVETLADLESAIHERTAMMMAYSLFVPAGKIGQQQWLEVARRRGVPTLMDAAADTPPVDTLSSFNRMGYDMVAFSGGKALLGPQDAGLLLGRKDLIEAAKLNTSPHCPTVGRGLKVSKEDMVAMWAAVERFVHLDHEAEVREWERRIGVIENALEGIPTVTTKRIVPPIANRVPHVLIFWDEKNLRITRDQVTEALRQGDPSIRLARVHGTGDQGLLVSVFMLQEGEDKIVASRLREVLEIHSK
jgi:L-seryl-tRNA(Ser) seleniumtransferase